MLALSDTNVWIQEALWNSDINVKNTTPKHIIVKFMEYKNKENILKVTKAKKKKK